MNVKLKTKKLKSGRLSFYLTYYSPETQKRHKEYLGLYLLDKPKNEFDRNHNKETKVAPRTAAFAYYLAEQYKEALPLYQDLANAQINNWSYLSRIGIIYAKMNNRESVEDVIQELKTNNGPTRKGSYKYALARIYSALNEKELATKYLKQAFKEGFYFNMARYDYDAELVPLHGYPAYEEFVKPKD